jgi:hypothetical protein
MAILRAGQGWPPGEPPLNPVLKAGRVPNDGNVQLNAAKLQALNNAFAGVLELGEGGAYGERFHGDGDQAAWRTFAVPWGLRKAWVDEVKGYTNAVSNPLGGPASLARVIPMQHPEQGYEHLYASDVELLEGMGAWVNNANVVQRDANGRPALDQFGQPQLIPMIAYVDGATGQDGYARYKVTYTPRMYTVLTDGDMQAIQGNKGELERYVERDMLEAVQALPIPAGSLVFNNHPLFPNIVVPANQVNKPIPANGQFILLPTAELIYEAVEWPDIPAAALVGNTNPAAGPITSCIGTVNSQPFDGARGCFNNDGQGNFTPWPAMTLLCQPPKIVRYRTPRGRYCHRVRYSFLYRPTTWQTFPSGVANSTDGSSQGQQFWPATYNVQGVPSLFFPMTDFNLLFVPPVPLSYQ